MAILDITTAQAKDMGITDYEVTAQALDYNEGDDVYVDFPNAAKYYGYYKKYGQLKKAIDTLWIYVVGKGYTTDVGAQVTLDHLIGIGEDTIHSILWNLGVTSMIQGDAFAEVIRKDDKIVNLKPISPERMRIIYGSNGIIKGYEYTNTTKTKKVRFKKEDIFHISNDRIADEQRGTSVIECCEWVINAIEEAKRDYRIVLHRNVVPVRIVEVDTDNTTKRNAFMVEYKEAISKGEVLVVPKGVVEFKQDTIDVQDPISWIQSLENYFYLAVGIPKVIASPDGLSEGSSKVSYLVFEPIYTYRQILLEADLWAQLSIKLKFNRPASLTDNIQTNENKNTSQTGFQPKDMSVNMGAE
jgi:hypothetical protein